MNALTVHEPGLLATVQDLGRTGHASVGVSVSGAADTLSARLANRVLNNHDHDALIEITLATAAFSSTVDTRIAIAGAQRNATIDGRPVFPLVPTRLPAGARLELATPSTGLRTYLAISGGVHTEPVLGSRSTHASTAFGSPTARTLRRGDTLPINPLDKPPRTPNRARTIELLRAASTMRLRTINGPALRCTVDPRSDRTGVRLIPDEPLPPTGPIDPEPTHPGAIQHTPDGALVALGPDAATTGGYPIVATVALVDMPALMQLRPHQTCTLHPVTIDEAAELLRAREAMLDAAIPPAHTAPS